MVGKVNLKIYFGTKFDELNIPYNTGLIRTTATKTISIDGVFLWQTTYLSELRVNISNYQDIVGAQYIEIIEDDPTLNYGSHWYTVLGYFQMSKKAVRIGILYDPLLTIGIQHITGISGVMSRWSVSDDQQFNYINTPEPLNQGDEYQYNYFRYNPLSGSGGRAIAGFPYDMTKKPKILEYMNDGGGLTQIYYPDMVSRSSNTEIFSNVGGTLRLQDGLNYYEWTPIETNTVYKNYSYAISLGHEITVNAYMLPISNLISIVFDDGGYISKITGGNATISSGLGLTTAGYNNAKAGEIGTFFSLYNEITGDGVTVNNYELNNTSIDISCNPYSSGCFYARFSSYLKDTAGFSGLVKSAGYQPLSIKSLYGENTATNYISNVMANDKADINAKNELLLADTALTNAKRGGMGDLIYNTLGGILGVVGGALEGDLVGMVGATATGVNANRVRANESQNAMANYDASLEIINRNLQQQKRELLTVGTMGLIAPPVFKLANNFTLEGCAYTFIVRKTTLSARDRQRADRFFTAFGYNVDNAVLDNVTQLNARPRFTFIMADDVNIKSVSGNTDLTRLRDPQTINMIKQRFSAGLRIWKEEPDFDWTRSNK